MSLPILRGSVRWLRARLRQRLRGRTSLQEGDSGPDLFSIGGRRRQAQVLFVGRCRPGCLLQLLVTDRERLTERGILRLERDGLFVLANGRRIVALAMKRHRQVEGGGVVVRKKRLRPAVTGDGFIHVPEEALRPCEVELIRPPAWEDTDGALEIWDRLGGAIESNQHLPQVAQRLGVVRILLNRGEIFRERSVVVPRFVSNTCGACGFEKLALCRRRRTGDWCRGDR